MDQKIEVSIVTPFFNEADNIEEYYHRVTDTMKKMEVLYEIMAIDDGSTDDTGKKLRDLSRKDPHLRVIPLSSNRGQSIAIAAGIAQSTGEYVIILDGDLQHAPEEIPAFIEKIREGYDMVSGKRIGRKESFWFRRVPSKFANLLLQKATRTKVGDMGGYKCLRGDIAKKIDLKPGYHRFLPAIVNQMGGRVTEIEITAPERKKGKSKYGMSRFLDVLMDILMLWFESSTKSRPLYFIGRICLAFFLIATLIFFWLVFEKLKFGYPIAARPPFFLSILLYTLSFIMFFQALVLEFLSDIYRKLTGNDNYIIKKTHPEKEEK